jgi:MFS family permease
MKTSKLSIKLAILLCSLLQMGTICISSVLTRIADLFPQYGITTIQFLATFPCFVIIIVSLVTGKLVEYISKKILVLISSVLYIVTAVGGFFFHGSLEILYVWETILGIAIGIFIPIGSSLIADYFDGDERSSMMGMQSSIIGVGGMLLSLLGGMLAAIDWYYNFLAFLLIIPGLFMAITGLPMDKPMHLTEKGRTKVKVTPKIVILYSVICFLFMLFFNTIPTNLAMYLKEHGIRGSVNAGIASAVLSFSCALAGLLYHKISRIIGELTISLGFFNLALGALVAGFSSSYGMILVGVFIAGMSISIVMAQSMVSISNMEKAEAVTKTMAIVLAINNFGSFLSPNFTKVSEIVMGNSLVASRYLLVSILSFLTAVSFYFILRKGKKQG